MFIILGSGRRDRQRASVVSQPLELFASRTNDSRGGWGLRLRTGKSGRCRRERRGSWNEYRSINGLRKLRRGGRGFGLRPEQIQLAAYRSIRIHAHVDVEGGVVGR